MHGPVTYTDIYDEITHHFRFINKKHSEYIYARSTDFDPCSKINKLKPIQKFTAPPPRSEDLKVEQLEVYRFYDHIIKFPNSRLFKFMPRKLKTILSI